VEARTGVVRSVVRVRILARIIVFGIRSVCKDWA
jgi:hypothetical protein